MSSTSAVRLTDALHVARSRNASDIHLNPKDPPAIRVDGCLEHLNGPAMEREELYAIAAALFDKRQVDKVNAGVDVSTTHIDDVLGVIRVHAFRVEGGIAIALRLLQKSVPSLESLHLPAIVASLCDRERGLILFAGPTGSGKSTSLAASIDRINSSSSRHIITIEDPIEYRHSSKRSVVVQRQIGDDAVSFSQALIGALRADPDIIVVGEMRDESTIQAALTAAETGHLVLASIHTGDAAQTIDRIVDAFSGSAQSQIRTQLSQALLAIISQRLVRRASAHGRRAVAEIVVATDAVRNIIREARTHQLRNVILTGRHLGMQTLENHLNELVARREITREAALAVTDRSEEITTVSSAVFGA